MEGMLLETLRRLAKKTHLSFAAARHCSKSTRECFNEAKIQRFRLYVFRPYLVHPSPLSSSIWLVHLAFVTDHLE